MSSSLRNKIKASPILYLNRKVLVTSGAYKDRPIEGQYLTIIGIDSSGDFLVEGFKSGHTGEAVPLISGKTGDKYNCLFIQPENVTFIKSVAKAKPNTLFNIDDL